jgi:hypothetical protein
MSEKVNLFMAKLKWLLKQHHVVLSNAEEPETPFEVFAVFMDDDAGAEGAYAGHPVYNGNPEALDFEEYPAPEPVEIENTDAGQSYMHCTLCLEEFKAGHPDTIGVSPKEYSRQQAAWTRCGLQVWCTRHDVNIVHVDFEGQRHPANTTRFAGEEEQE